MTLLKSNLKANIKGTGFNPKQPHIIKRTVQKRITTNTYRNLAVKEPSATETLMQLQLQRSQSNI
jgi:hypothetical protein